MKKYKYGVIGSFVFGKETYGGQSIKTKNFTAALKNVIGEDRVLCVDTHDWKKKPLRLIKNIRMALKECEDIVILPADRGVLVIPRLVKCLRGNGNNRLLYVVIGGWLPEFLQKRKGLTKTLQSYNGIFVETYTMRANLEKMGFDNIVVLPNFKQLNLIEENSLVYPNGIPYKLCTFSRVLKEKGIEEAINAVMAVNNACGQTIYTLDIYGQIDANYKDDFEQILPALPEYISYRGQVDGSKSTEIIKEYFALLFPTYFYGEGYPGTLLDAFSAGVPVLASDWRYNRELVGDDKGFLFEAKNTKAFSDTLDMIAKNPELLLSKKKDCLNYARNMTPESMIEIFTGYLE